MIPVAVELPTGSESANVSDLTPTWKNSPKDLSYVLRPEIVTISLFVRLCGVEQKPMYLPLEFNGKNSTF